MRRWSFLAGSLLLVVTHAFACRQGEDASRGEVVIAESAPTTGGLQRVLEHNMNRLDLLEQDLEWHESTGADLRAFRAAVKAKDDAGARGPHARLLQHLEVVAEDPELNPHKLARVRGLLEASRGSLPEPRRAAMAAHLDALAKDADAASRRSSVRKSLSALERRLEGRR